MNTPTDEDIVIARNIMEQEDGLKQRKDEIKESKAALGKRLSCSVARVNGLLKLVRKEIKDPGTIEFEQELITNAEIVAR